MEEKPANWPAIFDWVMPKGAFRGSRLSEVPVEYITSIAKASDDEMNGEMKEHCLEFIKAAAFWPMCICDGNDPKKDQK